MSEWLLVRLRFSKSFTDLQIDGIIDLPQRLKGAKGNYYLQNYKFPNFLIGSFAH